MKKYFQTAALLFIISFAHAQKLSLNHGKIEFYTETVLTDIEAFTENFEATLEIETGAFYSQVKIADFDFEYETMQEHFNRKYMESDKFPVATYKGTILQEISDITAETDVDAAGEITIHGVKKEMKIKIKISKKEGFTVAKFKFPVSFADFEIDEPSVLTKSVAKDVVVKGELYLN